MARDEGRGAAKIGDRNHLRGMDVRRMAVCPQISAAAAERSEGRAASSERRGAAKIGD